jgi:hypothetical protein
MTAPMTVAAVLDALAVWAEDGSGFWQGSVSNPANHEQTCAGEQVTRLTGIGSEVGIETYRKLDAVAVSIGYRGVISCNDRGGQPAVRQMIARARAEVGA